MRGADDQISVRHVVLGTPAFAAGLKAGDIILSLDGHSLENSDISDAARLMRGEVGTKVKVEVRRKDSDTLLSFMIERARIDIESVLGDRRNDQGKWRYTLEDHPQIGYVRITTFGDHTSSELVQAIGTLPRDVQGLIIDLRSNPGGLLDCAVQICDMFLPPDKTIVTARSRDNQIVSDFRSENPPLVAPSLPVVILVDQYSASASEIVSACLQDHGRATIVGARTWGKGTVQNVIGLDSGRSAMRLTTQTYWRPSEVNIHRHSNDTDADPWGVVPKPEDRIDYDVEYYQKVWQRRYELDVPNKAAATDSSVSATANETPVVDRQLERAVEVIRGAASKSIDRAASLSPKKLSDTL